MMPAAPALIARAFVAACADELEAPKPGNVHVYADGHRMTAEDFRRSAAAAAPALCAPGARLGERLFGAVRATRDAVGQNTNLGIVLLCAPLAMAAEGGGADLRASLARVLANTDVADTALAFRAIVLAGPGGLGEAPEYDVHQPATVTLQEAMAAAAARDRIAAQYVNNFADVFGTGLAALGRTRSRGWQASWATVEVFLDFLTAFPDSHVARRHGAAAAEELRRGSGPVLRRLQAQSVPSVMLPELLAWDDALKAAGVNPGTAADLTVATLFADRLRNILRGAHDDG